MIDIKLSRAIHRRRRQRRRMPRKVGAPLYLDGVFIPDEAIETGHCVAIACEVLNIKQGMVAADESHCPSCGSERQFFHERCGCGASKPWLYRRKLPPGRARMRAVTNDEVQFDDL